MKVLVAFDKFKDSMSAARACAVAAAAIREAHPDWTVKEAPLSDGGEGFAEILTRASGGRMEELEVHGARFEPVRARYGLVDAEALDSEMIELLWIPARGKIGILEMAQASGLESVAPGQRDPRHTSSYGTGELIRELSARGVSSILLGVGGSATTDCGTGALEALGVEFYDREMRKLERVTPARWVEVCSMGGLVNLKGKFPPLRIACDVRNPLLGERGATRSFGAQKGLPADAVDAHERAMHKMALRLLGLFGHDPAVFDKRLAEPGSGAAGGIAFGLRTALPNVSFVPGFNVVAHWLKLEDLVSEADIVITGEGRIDATSLDGKGPHRLMQLANKVGGGTRVFALAGAIEDGVAERLRADGTNADLRAITPAGMALEQALRDGPANLAAAVRACVG